MHGDITRSTFDPDKAYSSVRQQQGRVQLDADWNEQRDIELHDQRQARTDLLGAHGAPLDDPGMEVRATGSGLTVGAGRYYVEGIRVENPATLPVDLPAGLGDGRYLVYLELWERAVTAVEDPAIREVALGGPDTCTRTQVTWRVRLLPITTDPAPGCTGELPEWDALVEGGTGTLEVRAEAAATATDPCLVPETAGYQGLDNRTYRVQIHDGDFAPEAGGAGSDTPTFKWSRDNGSVLAAWTAGPQAGAGEVEVQVDRLGPGGTDGFLRGGWVELGNDRREDAGVLAQVDDMTVQALCLADPDGDLAGQLDDLYEPRAHPKVRAWDSPGAIGLAGGGWIELERGLQVRFSRSGSWRPGDFWVIPARTAVLPGTLNRQIDWPVDGDGDPLAVPAHSPRHQYARLAMVELDGTTWKVTGDCRQRFAPLVDDLQFGARGGEGQHAPSVHWLPAPLVVGASLGTHPLAGARVRFTVKNGGGVVAAEEPEAPSGSADVATEAEVTTGADGLARVWWRLGAGVPPGGPGDRYQPQAAQEVTAELLDDGGTLLHVPLTFTATADDRLLLVDAGGNGQIGRPGETLEIALRARVSAGTQPAAGQRVAFEIESKMLDGAALDELRGGSLHASVNVVDAQPWPGGSRTILAVVATDASGVAQVQWVLGTEPRLRVQRVTATLLGASGQQVLYSAHLPTAAEVGWAPCDALGKAPDPSVQGALDLFCHLLGALGTRGAVTTGDPKKSPPLVPETTVKLADWRGVELTTRLALGEKPSAKRLASGLVVTVEVPVTSGGKVVGHTTVRVRGTAELEPQSTGAVVRWSPTDAATLLKAQSATGELLVRVTLLPGLLAPDPPIAAAWYGAFHVLA